MAVVPDNLDSLKYAELQQLAKQCGVKANMKVSNNWTITESSTGQPESVGG